MPLSHLLTSSEGEEFFPKHPSDSSSFPQVYRKYGKEYGGQTSPNITYQYYAPGAPPDAGWAEGPRGSWSSVPTPCSVTCSSGTELRGHRSQVTDVESMISVNVPVNVNVLVLTTPVGVQKYVYVCVDGDTKEHLDERFCEKKAASTPPQQTACHLPACPSRSAPSQHPTQTCHLQHKHVTLNTEHTNMSPPALNTAVSSSCDSFTSCDAAFQMGGGGVWTLQRSLWRWRGGAPCEVCPEAGGRRRPGAHIRMST